MFDLNALTVLSLNVFSVLIGLFIALCVLLLIRAAGSDVGRYTLIKDGGSYTLLDTKRGVARIFIATGNQESGFDKEMALEISFDKKA